MGRMYCGNAPKDQSWVKVFSCLDEFQIQWLVFAKAQEHGEEWKTYKVCANGQAENKANYWFARNDKTGQIGYGRDLALMNQNKPELYQRINHFLDGLK